MNTPSMLKQTLLLILIAAISLGLGIWLSQNLSGKKLMPKDLEATFLDKGKPLAPFSLVDHDNKPFTTEQFKDHWTFLFFGYTNCPDVCPTTLKLMDTAWGQLDEQTRNKARMVFVSVDSDRDPPATLKKYVTYFHPDFIGITGKPDQLDILTRSIGVLYGFEDPQPGSKDYAVNHSSQIVLIDPYANLRAVFSPPHDPNKIASTFKKIRDFFEN